MEGFLPCTKSFWSDCQLCPWKAARHKIHRVRSKTTHGAFVGLKVHTLVAWIRKDSERLEEFTKSPDFLIGDGFNEVERQDIIDMVQRAFTSDPIVLSDTEAQTQQVEAFFSIDEKGRATKKDSGIWRGYLDRVVLRDDGSVVVDDLKTDRWPSDNVAERYSYVLGARCLFPNATVVRFGRHYLRTGSYVEWKYEFRDGKTHTCTETTPEGEKIKHGPFGQNPLLVYVKDFIAKIEKMEETPTPGPHCESWYGEPCQFLGNECPAAEELPAVIEQQITVITPATEAGVEVSKSELLRAIAGRQEGLVLTAADMGWAYSAFIQFQGFAKALEAAIKEWSRANGVFPVGETPYGWFTTTETEVDKPCALSEMLRTMTVAEVANVVSISKTSINTKIGKRKYPELREFLLSMAVTEVEGKPKFGAIKNEATDDSE